MLFRGEAPNLGTTTVLPGSASDTAFTINLQSGQTGDAIDVVNSAGTIIWSVAASGATSPAATLTATTQPTFRLTDSEVTLNSGGSTSIGAGSGSVAASRGAITLGATTTLSGGFEYGVQGKLTLKPGELHCGYGQGFRLGQEFENCHQWRYLLHSV
jgi:hypothetical protein